MGAIRTDDGRLVRASRWDPETRQWFELPDPPEGTGRWGDAIWTGSEVLVTSATDFFSSEGDLAVARFNPGTDSWEELPPSGFASRNWSATAWAEDHLLVWGGATSTGFTTQPFADGIRYRQGPISPPPGETQSESGPSDGVFDVHSEWIASDFNGQPLSDGITMSPGGISGTGPEPGSTGVIGGCLLGSEYPFVQSEDSLVVDEQRQLSDFDCEPPVFDGAEAPKLRALVFDDAKLEFDTDELILSLDSNELRFLARPSIEDLTGEWQADTLDGVPVESDWVIDFTPPTDRDRGVAQWRHCGALVATNSVFGTLTDIAARQPLNTASECDEQNEIEQTLRTFLSNGARIRAVPGGILELFNGENLIALARPE